MVTKKLVSENQIIQMFNAKKHAETLAASEEFLATFPFHATVMNVVGLTHKALGHFIIAESVLGLNIKHNPTDWASLNNLANLNILNGTVNKAIYNFKKALVIAPEQITAIDGLAKAFLNRGQLNLAIGLLKNALIINPKSEHLYLELGNIYRKQDNLPLAISNFIRSNLDESQVLLTECLYLNKGKDIFLKQYRRLVEIKLCTPLLGCLGTHARLRYNDDIENNFCNSPLEFISKVNLLENGSMDRDFFENCLKYSTTITRQSTVQGLLKNGEQSSGNLFQSNHPIVRKLAHIINLEIRAYRKKFASHNEGFLKNWPTNFELMGWLIFIKKDGKLKSHMHKDGWLSGSFYLKTPPKTHHGEGNIVFSLDGGNFPKISQHSKSKSLALSDADLCLFPSSLFHRTTTFSSEDTRISIAFDVVPKR